MIIIKHISFAATKNQIKASCKFARGLLYKQKNFLRSASALRARFFLCLKKPAGYAGGVCLCGSFTLQKAAKLLKVALQIIIAGGLLKKAVFFRIGRQGGQQFFAAVRFQRAQVPAEKVDGPVAERAFKAGVDAARLFCFRRAAHRMAV